MSDFDRLIRFAAVAEELSFSRAAKRLRVDQPWLSRQIQQLEAQLGFPLFVRSTRKVTLTPEGQMLLVHAAELAEVAERTREALRTLGRNHSSVIALGVNPYTFWLPARTRLLVGFRNRYKNAKVELVSNYTPRLISKVRKRTLDAALVPAPFRFDDLETLVVHSAAPSLLIPEEDPLSKLPAVPLSELKGRRIATTNPKLNPVSWEINYGPLFATGAEPFVVEEGQSAISFYARTERLVMISVSWPDSEQAVPAGFVHVPIAGPIHKIEYALLRRKEQHRLLMTQFWNMAREVAGDLADREPAAA